MAARPNLGNLATPRSVHPNSETGFELPVFPAAVRRTPRNKFTLNDDFRHEIHVSDIAALFAPSLAFVATIVTIMQAVNLTVNLCGSVFFATYRHAVHEGIEIPT